MCYSDCECRKSSRDCVNCLSRNGRCCNPITDPKQNLIISNFGGTRDKFSFTAPSDKICNSKQDSCPMHDKNKSDASKNDNLPSTPHSSSTMLRSAARTRSTKPALKSNFTQHKQKPQRRQQKQPKDLKKVRTQKKRK